MTHAPLQQDAIVPAPRFSGDERERRYAVVRTAMRTRGLDCLLIPHHTGEWDNYQADGRYLTCIGGGGAATAVVFPLDGEPIVAVREERRIAWWRDQQDWISDIRAPKAFSWAGVFKDAINERKLDRASIGIVGLKDVLRDAEGTAAFGEIDALKETFPRASFSSATDLMSLVRKQKSAEEIEVMRHAQACADAMSEGLRRSAKPGVPEHAIYASVTAAYIEAGGEMPTMILFNADPQMWQTHLMPRFRRVTSEDVVVLEAEAKFFGYIAQSIETMPLRHLSPAEARLLEVSKSCFDAVMNAMKPGVPYADLISLWEKSAAGNSRKAGRTMGHGIGQGQDVPLTTRGGKAGGLVVEEGDCFVLKPWVEDEAGTISVRFGANVVVGASGASVLTAARPSTATRTIRIGANG
jgi:Xaa-Pro aminopeptidase